MFQEFVSKLEENTIKGNGTEYHSLKDDGLAIEMEYGKSLMDKIFQDKPKVIVEIGTGRAYSTAWLMLGTFLAQEGQIYSFDCEKRMPYHNEGFPSFKPVIYRLGIFKELEIPKKIDFVFHDAQHKPNLIQDDLNYVVGNISSKACIWVHDVKDPINSEMKDYFKSIGFSYAHNNEGCGMAMADYD